MCEACEHPDTDEWIRTRLHPVIDVEAAADELKRIHWPRKPELYA